MNTLYKEHIKSISLMIALLVATFTFQSCDSEQSEPLDETAVTVEVAMAESAPGSSMTSFSGRIESNNQANLSTIVMGTITEVTVTVGDRVSQGDILARIKDDQIRAKKNQIEANMVQARANLENTEKNYNRIKNLYAENSATSKELDDISTMYDIAKANIEALEASLNEVNEMLAYTVIRAPFDGVISRKHASEGDMAAPGQPLLSISDPGTLKVTASVPERWITGIAEGDTVSVSVSAAGIDGSTAILTAVSEAGDPMSSQYAIEARFTDSDNLSRLKTGMFAEINIETGGDDALFIPQSALVERGQLTGVFTISDANRTLLRWVRTGDTGGEMVEILTGLTPGEQYIVSAGQTLQQGQLINIE